MLFDFFIHLKKPIWKFFLPVTLAASFFNTFGEDCNLYFIVEIGHVPSVQTRERIFTLTRSPKSSAKALPSLDDAPNSGLMNLSFTFGGMMDDSLLPVRLKYLSSSISMESSPGSPPTSIESPWKHPSCNPLPICDFLLSVQQNPIDFINQTGNLLSLFRASRKA